jgi:hypothetical protein
MLKQPASFLVNIIKTEMALTQSQVFVRNPDYVVPKTKGIFIAVGMVDSKVMSSRSLPFEDAGPPVTLKEELRVTVMENHQIDIFSRNYDALTRKWEIVAALRSIYSQQVQETNYFKIFRIPISFVDSSETEGPALIFKYSIVLPLMVWYAKTQAINSIVPGEDWYESFDTRVDDETTIGDPSGVFEFNIEGDVIS